MAWFEDQILAPAFGYSGRYDYYTKASCFHRLHQIQVPTFFINAYDDPIFSPKTFCFESFHKNPNIVFATNKHGGHLGYMESVFSFESWFIKIALKYFDAYL